MLVSELIEKLQQADPDLRVVVSKMKPFPFSGTLKESGKIVAAGEFADVMLPSLDDLHDIDQVGTGAKVDEPRRSSSSRSTRPCRRSRRSTPFSRT